MLTWDDQNTLATLASEQGETRTLSQPAREDWFGVADRLLAGSWSKADLLRAAHLARMDAAMQRDTATAKRYLDLATRAMAAL